MAIGIVAACPPTLSREPSGPVAEFARDLRRLRDSAGRPSYQELAQRAGFSVTALSEAAGGRSLPTLPVVKGYVGACGGDIGEWEDRWRIACAGSREAARQAPYLGLASYGPQHAGLFFGREQLTREVLERLAAGRFLAVFGPSGSGKSSLLRAGLLASVSRGDFPADGAWQAVLLTPGEQPLAALAGSLASATGLSAERVRESLLAGSLHMSPVPDSGLLLVVDQFEELFTLCHDPGQRDHFVRALLALAGADGAGTRV